MMMTSIARFPFPSASKVQKEARKGECHVIEGFCDSESIWLKARKPLLRPLLARGYANGEDREQANERIPITQHAIIYRFLLSPHFDF
jgi:hypothetical protein